MALHTVAHIDPAARAHSRGQVGVVRVVVGLALTAAAVVGVGAAATSATWSDGAYLGPAAWQVAQGTAAG